MDNDGDYLCGASEFFNLAKHNLQFNGEIKAWNDFDFRIPIAYCLHCNAYLLRRAMQLFNPRALYSRLLTSCYL